MSKRKPTIKATEKTLKFTQIAVAQNGLVLLDTNGRVWSMATDTNVDPPMHRWRQIESPTIPTSPQPFKAEEQAL